MIANLALYFAVHTLFAETGRASAGHARPAGAGVVVVPVGAGGRSARSAPVLVFGLRWPVLRTLGVCALLGLALVVGS